MPFKKQPYSWQKVKAGDIISFSYQSSRSTAKKVNCILVLNPKIPVTRKDGSNSFHMVGVKLKENQKGLSPFIVTLLPFLSFGK